MAAPVVPANLVPLAASIAKLAAQNPEIAELVVTVMTKAVDRALRLGPLKPGVWVDSFEASARQFANREFAKRWTKAIAVRAKSLASRFEKTQSDVEKAR